MIANIVLKSKSIDKKYNWIHDKQTGKNITFSPVLFCCFYRIYVTLSRISYCVLNNVRCTGSMFCLQQNKDFVVCNLNFK